MYSSLEAKITIVCMKQTQKNIQKKFITSLHVLKRGHYVSMGVKMASIIVYKNDNILLTYYVKHNSLVLTKEKKLIRLSRTSLAILMTLFANNADNENVIVRQKGIQLQIQKIFDNFSLTYKNPTFEVKWENYPLSLRGREVENIFRKYSEIEVKISNELDNMCGGSTEPVIPERFYRHNIKSRENVRKKPKNTTNKETFEQFIETSPIGEYS